MKSKIIILWLSLVPSMALQAQVLTISEAYRAALENSKNIKASVYEAEAFKQRVEQTEAELYPQVFLSGAYGKKEYGSNGFAKFSNYALSLQQAIYNPAITRQLDVEEAQASLSDTEVALQKQQLAILVLELYLEIMKSENRIKLYEVYTESNQNKLKLLEQKYRMALSNKMDFLQGEVEYLFSEIDLRKEKKTLRLNKIRLKHLIGEDSIRLPEIDFSNFSETTISQMRQVVSESHHEMSNLKLQMAQQSVTVSAKEIKSASSGHLPTLSLTGQYAEIDADRSVSNLENTKSLMLQLQIPLYQGGGVQARVDAAKLMHNSTREELSMIEDEIREEYIERLALFDASSHSLTLYQEALRSAELYLDSIEQGLSQGLKSKIERNDAQNKLYEVKYKYLENIYDILESYIGLLVLTNRLEELSIVDALIVHE